MLKKRLMKVQLVLAMGAILIAACGGGNVPEATPTLSAEQIQPIQTNAVSTFAADLTLTALSAPTNTPEPTITPSPAVTSTGGVPFGTGSTPLAPVAGSTSATSCYGLTFVDDVTIEDNTQMDPGETFTKTWKVQNSGSCAWDAGFKFQLSGGNAMGATAVTLPSAVAAGATYDISVPMTAPNAAGTVRGNWRMSTAAGQFFGDEVYVVIVVGSGGAAPAATNTTAPAAATDTTTTP
ncbi:MAG TPA: NBR1-Ig-like domain-containing protein [Anaerolineales bacterium]|nr:NBR1-Ig-like domain-containing protein [Anaerolineales bacterium]